MKDWPSLFSLIRVHYPNESQCHIILDFYSFSFKFRTERQVQDYLPCQIPSLCPSGYTFFLLHHVYGLCGMA